MIDGILIRPIADGDLDPVTELERLCFSDPWTREMFAETLSNPLAVYLVAEEEGELIGYVGMYHIMSEGQITNIAVIPERQRRGVATKLFSALLDYSRKNGIDELTLEVRDSNTGARALYERFGFRTVGTRKNYYRAPMENAVLMTKEL